MFFYSFFCVFLRFFAVFLFEVPVKYQWSTVKYREVPWSTSEVPWSTMKYQWSTVKYREVPGSAYFLNPKPKCKKTQKTAKNQIFLIFVRIQILKIFHMKFPLEIISKYSYCWNLKKPQKNAKKPLKNQRNNKQNLSLFDFHENSNFENISYEIPFGKYIKIFVWLKSEKNAKNTKKPQKTFQKTTTNNNIKKMCFWFLKYFIWN